MSGVNGDADLLFDWLQKRAGVAGDLIAMLLKAFDVSPDGVLGHCPGLFQRIAFGDKTWQGWTGDNISTFGCRLEKNRELIFCTGHKAIIPLGLGLSRDGFGKAS